MAATRLIALHINKGGTTAGSLKARLDYAENPEKTEGKSLISSYECDPETAWQEFDLSHKEYARIIGREGQTKVIAYQIRQSFKPGEITPEEANRVGYETAMRFTKGKHAFVAATHTDRAHIHNHIIFNSVSLDSTRRWRNFFLSAKALQRLSDLICAEHGLSVIRKNPGPRQKGKRIWERDGSAGNSANAAAPTRPGTSDRGKAGHDKTGPPPRRQMDLIIDIEAKLREGKGKGYEYWATAFNNKQQAEVLLFLQDNSIHSIEDLTERADRAAEKYTALLDAIREKEQRLKDISSLKRHITDYSKTRAVYEGYRRAGYSRKYLEEHREEIETHKAAKAAFDSLGLKKIPKVKELTEEYTEVLSVVKAARKEYRAAREDMKLYTTARKNVSMILGGKEKTGREQSI